MIHEAPYRMRPSGGGGIGSLGTPNKGGAVALLIHLLAWLGGGGICVKIYVDHSHAAAPYCECDASSATEGNGAAV